MPVNVDLPLAVGIPAEYIPDQDLRLRLYRRIADLRDETEIDALTSEFQDRFGELPEMVSNLFYQMRVKLRAEGSGLSAVSWESGQVILRYPSSPDGKDPSGCPILAPGYAAARMPTGHLSERMMTGRRNSWRFWTGWSKDNGNIAENTNMVHSVRWRCTMFFINTRRT